MEGKEKKNKKSGTGSLNNVCMLHVVCDNQKGRGHRDRVQQCFVIVVFSEEGGTFNSTKGRVTVRVGGVGGGRGGRGEQGDGV